MKKLLTVIGSILIIIAVGVFAYWSITPFFDEKNPAINQSPTTEDTEEGTDVCAQVITPARNPETKNIVEFPTPCDVPEGWEVIENDIPSLDLDLL